MKITRQDFKKAIREEIIEILSDDNNSMDEATTIVDKNTKSQNVTDIDPITVKSAIDTAKKTNKPVTIAKENEDENNSFPSPGVGSFVTIPINLTTDPINKQGEKGEVKFIDNDGNFYILFDDGLVGAYQGDIFDLQEEVNLNEEDEIYTILKPAIQEISIPSASEIKSKFKDLVTKVKQQGGDAKKALIMLVKAAKGDINLTNNDKAFIKLQLKDAIKAVLGAAIFTLPAGSLILILLKAIKLHGLVVPSSFLNERLEPYEFKVILSENEDNTTRYGFTTNQGTEYLVDLIRHPETEVIVEYGAIKDGKKSWVKPTNNGEPLKIISTVTEIIKEYYVSNPSLEVVKMKNY